jgi:hypothetical protein
LRDAEARRIEHAFRRATDRKLLERLQIVRPAHRGRKPQDIAADLVVSTRTVQRWLEAYVGGLDLLWSHKAPRRPPKAPLSLPPSFAGS